MATPKSYIICATPRSGTTLLCRLLASTGVAGNPDSFFRRPSIAWWANHWEIGGGETMERGAFSRAFLAAALKEGEGGTGIFGLRIMREHVQDACAIIDDVHPGLADDAARLEAAFGQPLYIHLSRRDKVAQAVSLVKAEQTGLWHQAPDGTELERTSPPQTPEYDFNRIDRQVSEFQAWDAKWKNWFRGNELEPMQIAYEELALNPAAILANILDQLGIDTAFAREVEPEVAKLADSINAEWISRYRQEKQIEDEHQTESTFP